MELRHKLDRIDVRILTELQRNGRITNIELADLVGLSPSPCLLRVKKLQASGYILGYAAKINAAKMGDTLTVFTEVTLKSHHRADFARFQDAVQKIDACIECHFVSGDYDYLLKFVTAGIVDYQATIEQLLDRDVGIDQYFSFLVISSPFTKSHMPLMQMFADRI